MPDIHIHANVFVTPNLQAPLQADSPGRARSWCHFRSLSYSLISYYFHCFLSSQTCPLKLRTWSMGHGTSHFGPSQRALLPEHSSEGDIHRTARWVRCHGRSCISQPQLPLPEPFPEGKEPKTPQNTGTMGHRAMRHAHRRGQLHSNRAPARASRKRDLVPNFNQKIKGRQNLSCTAKTKQTPSGSDVGSGNHLQGHRRRPFAVNNSGSSCRRFIIHSLSHAARVQQKLVWF